VYCLTIRYSDDAAFKGSTSVSIWTVELPFFPRFLWEPLDIWTVIYTLAVVVSYGPPVGNRGPIMAHEWVPGIITAGTAMQSVGDMLRIAVARSCTQTHRSHVHLGCGDQSRVTSGLMNRGSSS
jgi:hypothetical protein